MYLKDIRKPLKVNITKTEALELGNFNGPICPDLKIQWVAKSTRVLGIQITKDKDSLLSENYNNILERIESRLKGWKKNFPIYNVTLARPEFLKITRKTTF